MFPVASLTSRLSINAIALQKSGMSYLNKKKILEPLEYLLPDKVETIVKEVSEQTKPTEKKPEISKEKNSSAEIVTPQEWNSPGAGLFS